MKTLLLTCLLSLQTFSAYGFERFVAKIPRYDYTVFDASKPVPKYHYNSYTQGYFYALGDDFAKEIYFKPPGFSEKISITYMYYGESKEYLLAIELEDSMGNEKKCSERFTSEDYEKNENKVVKLVCVSDKISYGFAIAIQKPIFGDFVPHK